MTDLTAHHCPHGIDRDLYCGLCDTEAKSKELFEGIASTLAQRGSRYGDFADNARIGDKLLEVMMGDITGVPTNWSRLDPTKRQGLMLIAQKLARALSPSADPEYKDNWHDIQGYAKLIEDRCLD